VESERHTTEFTWNETEDDSVSKDRVVQELSNELHLPSVAVLITLERKILFRYEGVHKNKRTKLNGKIDYAIVLKRALNWILLSPQDSLHYMVLLFETKVSSAMNKQLPKCRGAAAVECLAANLLLQAQGHNTLPEGLPIILTDMNRYEIVIIMLSGTISRLCWYSCSDRSAFCTCLLDFRSSFSAFMLAQDEAQAVEEVRFANKAVALDVISQLVQQHSQHVDARATGKHPQQKICVAAAADQLSTADGANDASTATDDQLAGDLREADVTDFARNVCAKLLPGCSSQGFSVMMETLSSALSRAVQKKLQPARLASEEDITYERVPACYAHMFS
jgi:hypothetical protein